MSINFVVRLVGMTAAMIAGWILGSHVGGALHDRGAVAGAIIGLLGGLLLTPYVTWIPYGHLMRISRRATIAEIAMVLAAIILGLLAAALLTLPLSLLPGWAGRLLPLAAVVLCVYLCLSAVQPHLQGLPTGPGLVNQARSARDGGPRSDPILVDTSAIIDGRIADISQTGFITGTLVIPRFVLGELQYIADSSEALRRNRGRRGLDMLNKLQKESMTPIQISDVDMKDVTDVDSKLVRLAQSMHAPIITNDFNLNRVAELQGVTVLNVNQLANAVKPVVLPGEEMHVDIIQEGREYGQGVGYLEDGTMVVVENGRRHINAPVEIVVTRVLQTPAGRMIFGQPKEPRGGTL